MKLIKNYDIKEVNKFIKNNNSYFMQTHEWINFQKDVNKVNTFTLSLVNNNKVLAVSFIIEKKLFKNIKYYYSPRGFVIDYNNKELLTTFTKLIKEYAKENKSIFIKIDPDKTIDKEVVNNLIDLGYKHFGYNQNFETNLPRFTYVLNLENDLIKGYHPNLRREITRGNIYNLNIKRNDCKIEDFYLTMKETQNREDILFSSMNYYDQFYKILHKHNMSDIYSISYNKKDVKNILTNTINDLNKQIKDVENDPKYLNKKKKQNTLNDLNNKLRRPTKLLEELKNINDNNNVLSSLITIKHLDTVYLIHGGNRNILRELSANYLLYDKIINDAKEDGYKYLDFFGTTGDDDINNPVYGIKLFKQRFGGDLVEYIGEFDLVVNKFLYNVFITLIPIYRKIVRFILKKK